MSETSIEPEFVVEPATDQISINWHGDPPEQVVVYTELLESMLQARNALAATKLEQARTIDLMKDRMSALEMLLNIIRLGRRPNRRDWDDARLPPITQEVRLDLLSRKSRPR